MDFEERVHPDLREMLSCFPEMEPPSSEDIPSFRESIAQMFSSQPEETEIAISNRFIPGPTGEPEVKVRVYEPRNKTDILPVVLYFHGGGYWLGAPEWGDAECKAMVTKVGCVVVSVDYRLAPENLFPAALEDCYAALTWIVENARGLGVDASRIALMGGSAGGGLAAAISLLARDRKGPSIRLQMPLYPMIDDRCATPSHSEILDLRVSNGPSIATCWEFFLGKEKGEVSPYAAPTRAADLSGLPPAYICVGELDPFRDETIDYVSRLIKAGVPVEFHLYSGCFHGFESMIPDADISRRANQEYIAVLKSALKGDS